MEQVSPILKPTDVVLLVSTLTMLPMIEIIHRHVIGPNCPNYSSYSFRDRFDWDRRIINLSFQILQMYFNLYILLFDTISIQDCIYGYSIIAHKGFIIILAFYIYDTVGMVMHPASQSTTPLWIIHHLITISLLCYNMCYRQTSAFLSSTFLISAASHIPNELRWLFIALNIKKQSLFNLANLLCCITCFITCVFPPPYSIYRVAKQLQSSIFYVITNVMRFYCIFFTLLIYVPHLLLVVYQLHRTWKQWNQPPKPFHQKKVE